MRSLPELDDECITRVLALADRPIFQSDVAGAGGRVLVRSGDRALRMGLDRIEQEQDVQIRSNTFALLRIRVEAGMKGFAPAPDVVLRVAALLNDKRPYVSDQAQDLLGTFGASAEPAVPMLLERFRTGEVNRRCSLCRVFGQIGPAAAPVADDILKFMETGNEAVVGDGLWSLSSLRVNRKDIMARFIEASRSADFGRRVSGIRGLAGIASESPEALAELLALMKDELLESRVLEFLLEFDVRTNGLLSVMLDMLREPIPAFPDVREKQVESRHYYALQYLHRAGQAEEATIALLAERAADSYPSSGSGPVTPMIVLRDLVGDDRRAYEMVEKVRRARKRGP